MKLFGRKKSKEEEEFEEEEDTRERKKFPRSKEFKDLNPENKPRRKEIIKPWGKYERFFVLIILFITVGASGVLFLSSRNWKLPGLPRLQVPSKLPFANEKRVVAGSEKDEQVALEVKEAFQVQTKALTGLYAFSIVQLDTGYSFGESENEVMQAASLIKLPVMAALFAEAEKGNVYLDAVYALRNLDKVGGAGSLVNKPAGYKLTYRELVTLMGKESDNTAFNIVRRMLGDEKIDSYIRKFGMPATSLSENKTTPKDVSTFFKKLWRDEIISKDSKEEFLENITNTAFEDWITAGTPDVRVAHKYGREVHVVNDGGVVFTDKPYVLVIMSQGIVDGEADAVFPNLARSVYGIESSY